MAIFQRELLGIAIGPRRDAMEAAVLRLEGIGLGITPSVAQSSRVRLSAETVFEERGGPSALASWLEAIRYAVCQVSQQGRLESQRLLALGLLVSPGEETSVAKHSPGWHQDLLAEAVAEQSGITTISDFSLRDRAAGGSGQLIEAAADYLLFRHSVEERILIRLGSVTTILWIPPGGKITELIGLTAGPGHRLLDEIVRLGTRGREFADTGGKKAVQGRFLEALQSSWLEMPFLSRRPPRILSETTFGPDFLTHCFEKTRQLGGTLADLLCTATHFIAGCVADAVHRWLPPAQNSRRILLAGEGCRNGFLWKRLAEHFPRQTLEPIDAVGVPNQAGLAAAAGVLAVLTLDGVAGNLPLLTGASGGRLVGRIVPGDLRNWAACTQWMARRTGEYLAISRAA